MTVTIGGTTGTDLSLDPASLTFTEQNWDVPQTVTGRRSTTATR